jgi:hypothetical protein
MVKMWSDFAKSSDPTPAGSGQPFTWTKYSSQTPLYLEITQHPGLQYSILYTVQCTVQSTIGRLTLFTACHTELKLLIRTRKIKAFA